MRIYSYFKIKCLIKKKKRKQLCWSPRSSAATQLHVKLAALLLRSHNSPRIIGQSIAKLVRSRFPGLSSFCKCWKMRFRAKEAVYRRNRDIRIPELLHIVLQIELSSVDFSEKKLSSHLPDQKRWGSVGSADILIFSWKERFQS